MGVSGRRRLYTGERRKVDDSNNFTGVGKGVWEPQERDIFSLGGNSSYVALLSLCQHREAWQGGTGVCGTRRRHAHAVLTSLRGRGSDGWPML
ncbi:hypothetical protein E2C01_076482 [Portunus trituberculatus]|uniref:Uncharacterized protein n=1 Tax=Portunus trituberculatus TaxID=210409 RepID=A0A5B7IIN2_PORTR|nr:hypothetical protein [Portunus trituberculatus]